ncbi:MAG: hypothetical protein LBI28_03960 [Treponema sp.]|jgi:hypothetical protein|nr:hypothetical protein [Treponema sp.]
MKTFYKLTTVFALALQLVSCGDILPSRYALQLPKVPESWLSLLGEPCWRIEWLSPSGQKQTMDIQDGSKPELELPISWVSPVTAFPYCASQSVLVPGVLKPAGALFPFDVEGDHLLLSWSAGADTVFYWELALANEGNYSRLPSNFDWLRFRDLFASGTLSEALCEDPWIVDWRYAAERTIRSGFRTSYISAEKPSSKTIPDAPTGTWYGTSPFEKPLFFDENETPAFPVRSGVNLWFCADGILKVNGEVSMFIEWQR